MSRLSSTVSATRRLSEEVPRDVAHVSLVVIYTRFLFDGIDFR